MNVTTVNNNINKAQANIRYPEIGNVRYVTDSKEFDNYGLGIKQKDNDTTPSDAIQDLMDSKSFLDCERLALTVTYQNALDKLGTTAFNSRVRTVRISTTIPFRQVPERLQGILESIRVSEDQLEVGDWVYLKNTPRYAELCDRDGSRGAYTGEHLIVSDTNPLRFRGHINSIDYNDGYPLDWWQKTLHEGTPFNTEVPLSDIQLATENGLILARRIKD